MKHLIVYLCGQYRGHWFSEFARRLCREFVEPAFDLEYAAIERSCGQTSFPIYRDRDGHEITIHPYSVAFQAAESGRFTLLTSHYRPLDFFEAYGFHAARIRSIFTAHYNARLLEFEVHAKLRKEGSFFSSPLAGDESRLPALADEVLAWFRPWIFRPERWGTLDALEGSHRPSEAVRAAYFRGTANMARKCLPYLETKADLVVHFGDFVNKNVLAEESYFSEVLAHRIALSLPGAGDWCHRDVECFALGIPVVRPRFASALAFPFPDDAYVPVEYTPVPAVTPSARPWHPADPAALADAIQEKVEEVLDEDRLLDETAARALAYYRDYLKWPRCGQHTAQMMDLSEL